MKNSLKNIKFIIFDLDGIFYRGYLPIQGGKEIIKFCREKNIEYCFLTNNSCYPISIYQEKLLNCGIEARTEQIITTTVLLEQYLVEQSLQEIYVLGSPHLKRVLYKKFTKTYTAPDALILGMDDDMTLLEISQATNLIGENTKIIAANPDKLIPKQQGYDLECGVIIDIVNNATKSDIFVVGKPNNYAYDYILRNYHMKAEETLMIGDTYDTDILGAINKNILSAWIGTGNALPSKMEKKNFFRFDSLFYLKEEMEKGYKN